MIRLPLIGDAETETNDAAIAPDERPSFGGIGRKLLAAAVLGGVAFVLARRLGSAEGEPGPAGDETAEGASSISIDEPGDETELAGDVPGVERSPEEIAERVGEDVGEKPAEPGEMAIDESIVEDAVDESELAELENEGETGEEGGRGTESGEDAETDDSTESDQEEEEDAV